MRKTAPCRLLFLFFLRSFSGAIRALAAAETARAVFRCGNWIQRGGAIYRGYGRQYEEIWCYQLKRIVAAAKDGEVSLKPPNWAGALAFILE